MKQKTNKTKYIVTFVLSFIIILISCKKDDKTSSLVETSSDTKNGTVVFINATLINGTGELPKSNITILIENGVIKEIGKTVTAPTDVKVIDLNNQYVIPGLIDGHLHLTDGEETDYGKSLLREKFAHGITSVRDMAGNGTALKKIQQWGINTINPAAKTYFSALISGPDFIANDDRVTSSAGNSIAGKVSWMPKLDATTDIQKLVSDAKIFGVTGLKLYADISPELVTKVTAEARTQGLKVWSHALLNSAIADDLLNPGVDGITHAEDLSSIGKPRLTYQQAETIGDSTPPLPIISTEVTSYLNQLKTKGIILDATLAVSASVGEPVIAEYSENITKRANELGVLIGAGTDNEGTLVNEITLLVTKSNLTPMQAIQAATINNAKVLGIEAEYGTVEVGKKGDLVILSADPLIDITNLNNIVYTVKQGRVFSCLSGKCILQ